VSDPIELPQALWRALAVMSTDTGVEPEALVRQAVFAWLRINGYVVPSPLRASPEPEAPPPTDGSGTEGLDERISRLEAAAREAAVTPLPEALAAALASASPSAPEPPGEPTPAPPALLGGPLALSLEREGQPPVQVLGDRFVIGRGPQCDLIIDSPRVSREHAALVRHGASYHLEDLASSNGTFVGDERITRQALESGDVVRLGNEVMQVVLRPPG
jgi:hypothetical protein